MPLLFYVARNKAGKPLFMKTQSFQSTMEQFKYSIETTLMSREDVEVCVIHRIDDDIQVVGEERRTPENGFHQCYACEQIAYKNYTCCDCGRQTCKPHRKPHPDHMMSWFCLECFEVYLEQKKVRNAHV